MGSLTYVEPDLVIKTEVDSLKEDHEMMDLGEEGLRLDTLPAETLLHVLEYLDVKFITETLSQVCVKFRVFAINDETWRIRISRRWPGQYPAVALTANQRPGIDASTNQKPVLDVPTNKITAGEDEVDNSTNQKPVIDVPTNKITAGEDEVDNSTNRKPGVNQTPGVEILANQSSGMEASTNRKPGVFSWTEACIAREEECKLWGAQESSGALSMRATVWLSGSEGEAGLNTTSAARKPSSKRVSQREAQKSEKSKKAKPSRLWRSPRKRRAARQRSAGEMNEQMRDAFLQ